MLIKLLTLIMTIGIEGSSTVVIAMGVTMSTIFGLPEAMMPFHTYMAHEARIYEYIIDANGMSILAQAEGIT